MDLKQWQEQMAYSAASGVLGSIMDARKKAYENEGLSTDDMVVALWELLAENRPQAMQDMQAKRVIVKQKNPKV